MSGVTAGLAKLAEVDYNQRPFAPPQGGRKLGLK